MCQIRGSCRLYRTFARYGLISHKHPARVQMIPAAKDNDAKWMHNRLVFIVWCICAYSYINDVHCMGYMAPYFVIHVRQWVLFLCYKCLSYVWPTRGKLHIYDIFMEFIIWSGPLHSADLLNGCILLHYLPVQSMTCLFTYSYILLGTGGSLWVLCYIPL